MSLFLQLKFNNYEHNCQPQVLTEILQRKTLYQERFDHDFLEIYWLIESKVVSVISPHHQRNIFFSEGKQKVNASGVSTGEYFLR